MNYYQLNNWNMLYIGIDKVSVFSNTQYRNALVSCIIDQSLSFDIDSMLTLNKTVKLFL